MRSGNPHGNARRRLWPAVLLLLALGSLPAQAREHHHRTPHAGEAPAPTAAPPTAAPPEAGEAAAPEISLAAVKRIEDAYRQSPSAELLYQLGVQAQGRGKLIEAQDFMRRYLADPLTDAAAPGRGEAERVLAQPRPQSGEVQILADQYGLVSVDGRLVGALPLPLPLLLPVGPHVVALELRDRTMHGKLKVINGRGLELRFSRASGAVVVTLPPAVIVLPQLGGGAVAPELLRRVQQTVEQAIGKARLAVFSSEVALAHSPKAAACLSTLPCQAQLAADNEVDYTLVLRLAAKAAPASAPGSEALTAQLALIDAETADTAASQSAVCSGCTGDQLVAALPDAVRQLIRDGQGRPRGTLSITSQPPGADIRLGERVLGQTPYTHPMFVGTYELTLHKPEFEAARVQAEVKEGKTAALAVSLTAAEPPPAPLLPPPPPPPPPRRPRWRLALGGATLGVGVLVLGFGLSALGVDGQCVADPIPPAQKCLRRFATLDVGGALTGVGLGLSAAGALLIAIPNPPPRPSATALAPAGVGLTLAY